MKQIKETFERLEKDLRKVIGESESKLEERIAEHLESFFVDTIDLLKYCESPIEKIMAFELHQVLPNSELEKIVDVVEIMPQSEIQVFQGGSKEKTYRVDLLIRATKFCAVSEPYEYHFAIECDGHDYHEKSKEQATRDRQRERDLMEHGITVIRFTGSEIYEDPFGCASQALRIMENYIRNLFKFS